MRIAVLDLGSTTFHLEHFAVARGRVGASSLDEKLSLRLGDAVFRSGRFDASTRERVLGAVAALLSCSRTCAVDARVVVATAPFRAAENAPDVIAELRSRHGVDISVLSEQQEAELAYLGASACVPKVGGRRVVVDLGGGSAEVAVGVDDRCLTALSLPVGAVRLARMLAPEGALSPEALLALRRALEDSLREPLAAIRRSGAKQLVFASGTARAVRKLMAGPDLPPGRIGALRRRDLRRGLATHLNAEPQALVQRGVDPARADSIVVAAAVMEALSGLLGIETFAVCASGLRTGVALGAADKVLVDASSATGATPSGCSLG